LTLGGGLGWLMGKHGSMLDAPNAEHGLHRYWRAAFTEQISDALIGELVAAAGKFSSPVPTEN
jgi:hypothetical protein